jgi:hypothetical protein
MIDIFYCFFKSKISSQPFFSSIQNPDPSGMPLFTLKYKILKNLFYRGKCCQIIGCAAHICLKVHKIENFFGSDFEFCVISLLVMLKYLGFVKNIF